MTVGGEGNPIHMYVTIKIYLPIYLSEARLQRKEENVVRGEGNPIGMYRKGEFRMTERRISTVLMNRRGEFRMTGIEAPLGLQVV